MPPKYQPGRIKLAKLVPTTKPVAAPLEPCSADSIEMKAPSRHDKTHGRAGVRGISNLIPNQTRGPFAFLGMK
jgi:hypothetical protein